MAYFIKTKILDVAADLAIKRNQENLIKINCLFLTSPPSVCKSEELLKNNFNLQKRYNWPCLIEASGGLQSVQSSEDDIYKMLLKTLVKSLQKVGQNPATPPPQS